MTSISRIFRNKYASIILRILASPLTIAGVTLILQGIHLQLANQVVVLIYLLAVMLTTVLWGLAIGVLTALLAFLTFNYYFLVPYYTLRVHAAQDLILLIIFLIVAVVLAQLIGQARAGERLARSREWEATRMYILISALARLQDVQEIAQSLADNTREAFDCERVEVTTSEKSGEPAVNTIAGNPLPISAISSRFQLETARGREGELTLWLPKRSLSPQEQRLLEAFANQGALAMERIRLSRGEKRSRLLEESDKLKSSLLSSVSHDFRTPLAAIKASVSSLRSRTVDWDEAAREDLLATIEEETDHLNLLVGNLLDMSRIESGALKPNRTWNAISEIAWGVIHKMRTQLQNHEMVVTLPNDLPLVPTDYIMMEQVFTNLLSNSIKYTRLHTPIGIHAAVDGDSLHVSVSNQSAAVPEEHLDRIFDKFHRITEVDRITGTGLGLSICKGLIEAHGGRIWAQNEPNAFVIHFTLPLTLDGALPVSPHEADNG